MDINAINNRLEKLTTLHINELNPRKKLYILLTLINIDIPNDICEAIDKIIYSERSTPMNPITSNSSNIILYKGDITQLKVDAIVNAANSDMLGCFEPNHKCIDNIIHSKAGPRLRMACRKLKHSLSKNGSQYKLGTKACMTDAYCLPCQYILHVAGPIFDSSNNQDNELAFS